MKGEMLSIVADIPNGKVMAYGDVASQLDITYDIKTSGYIVWRMLSSMPESEWMKYPWWRVINKQWYISSLKLGRKWLLQKQLLEKEWIEVINDTVDMKKYRYVAYNTA
jgi:methylated-DNA-protein-cysteine methyltransferase related protein